MQANIDHLQDPATGSSTGYLALAKVTGTEAVDAQRVRLTLSEPDSALLESLSQPWVAIAVAGGPRPRPGRELRRPGRHRPVHGRRAGSSRSRDHLRAQRRPTTPRRPTPATRAPPTWTKIIWRFIPESASRYAALQAGEVDIIDNAQPDTIAQAAKERRRSSHLDAPRPGASNRIELNSGKAPFNDPLVREAFIRSVNVNDGVASLFFGTAERSYSAAVQRRAARGVA